MARQQEDATTSSTKKHPGGRPTKLTKELIAKAATYLNECKMGGLFYGDLPTVPGLSIYLDVARASIYEWRNQDSPLAKEFSDTLERINTVQQYMLVGKGLRGEYNTGIAKMLLNVNHGMVENQRIDEKSEQTVTVITRKYDEHND